MGLSKSNLFPVAVTNELFNKIAGKSSFARLSQSEPIKFNGTEMFTFSFDNEADIVAENGAKGVGGATIEPVNMVPFKIEYGTRISDEFVTAAEEVKLNYLKAFADGFAKKAARALDIAAMHGLNPRTGLAASTVIGNNHMDYIVTNTVERTASANADVESAIALVQGAEIEVNGMAMCPAFKSALAAQVKSNGDLMFPELAWGSEPDTIKGLPVDVNSTVSFGTNTKDEAIVGNFRDYFKFGVAKDVTVKLIEYGNPDNSEDGDLQGHNQVYLRGEMYIGYGILDKKAFARIGDFV